MCDQKLRELHIMVHSSKYEGRGFLIVDSKNVDTQHLCVQAVAVRLDDNP
jgi:hypothetical protein